MKARARDFNFVDFVCENRSSNVDAHNLAWSLISFVPGRHVWLRLMAFIVRNEQLNEALFSLFQNPKTF